MTGQCRIHTRFVARDQLEYAQFIARLCTEFSQGFERDVAARRLWDLPVLDEVAAGLVVPLFAQDARYLKPG